MRGDTLGAFLTPEGFAAPAAHALLREASLLAEAGRYAAHRRSRRRERRDTPYAVRLAPRAAEPVLLVPGFLAGDGTLGFMARALRDEGFRTYRSMTRANIGCTLDAAARLEERLEHIAAKRGTRVQLVGHSLGGMLSRGVAARRPDLVSNVVTMGSPMLAPGAHHGLLSRSVELLVRMSRAGLPGMMAAECVAGSCARQSFEECRLPLPTEVDFTAIWSKRDGIVDWRACIDPQAASVEVTASHVGMAVDPRVIEAVVGALHRHAASSVLEVDRGVSA